LYVAGVVLSPLLFNIYINSIILAFKIPIMAVTLMIILCIYCYLISTIKLHQFRYFCFEGCRL